MKQFHISAGKNKHIPKGYKIPTKRLNVAKRQLQKQQQLLMWAKSREKENELPF